jgi:hypothetical protein
VRNDHLRDPVDFQFRNWRMSVMTPAPLRVCSFARDSSFSIA